MSDATNERAAFSYKTAELVVAGFIFALGAIVMVGSWQVGARWVADGPQSGYFPFYVGLIICVASAVNFVRGLLISKDKSRGFVEVGQLKLVLSVLVPSSVYVALVGWLGIYVASIIYIGFFMRWLGKYPWWKVVLVSIGTMAAMYVIFEVWFLVPLPKGPVEALLHID
jgi:putative tricarboxylic transport membrane protein